MEEITENTPETDETPRAPQPDEEQPVRRDTDADCFAKARANGEPTFTLRAQDITADLVVDFWVLVQDRMRNWRTPQTPLEEAVSDIRREFGIPDYIREWYGANPKLQEAIQIKLDMRACPMRKLAD